MYNDFVIVGPNHDPAKIKDKKNISEIMKILSNQIINLFREMIFLVHIKKNYLFGMNLK